MFLQNENDQEFNIFDHNNGILKRMQQKPKVNRYKLKGVSHKSIFFLPSFQTFALDGASRPLAN